MTDEQIINGLECHISDTDDDSCRPCVFNGYGCLEGLIPAVADLINRQKAEIERVKKRNTLLLKKKCKDINTARKIIKSEAIKEFAERLKSEYEDEKQGRYVNWLMTDIINNLVKEMTEDDNGQA